MTEILLPHGTMVTSAARGFARDYKLDEDLTSDKETIWVEDEFGELYHIPVETIIQVREPMPLR